MFVTICISTTKIQKISEITNFFEHFLIPNSGNMFYRFYRYSLKSKYRVVSLAFMSASMAFCVLNDTIYPFYIFFGAVLINKMSYFENLTINVNKNNANNRF